MNVVLPLDRLDELAADGTIGAVSDVHLSDAGNQLDLGLTAARAYGEHARPDASGPVFEVFLRHAHDRAVARFSERAGAGRTIDADGIPARVAPDIRGDDETAALGLDDDHPPPPGGSSTGRVPADWCSTRAPRCATPAPSNRSGSPWPPATADPSPRPAHERC